MDVQEVTSLFLFCIHFEDRGGVLRLCHCGMFHMIYLQLLWTLVFCICIGSNHALLKTKSSDIAVLEDLYISTSGENWDYASMRESNNEYNLSYLNGVDWKFTRDAEKVDYIIDPCIPHKFQGINCTCDNSTCQIIQLAPASGNLIGTIPSSLGRLTDLSFLDLDTNQLTSSIPASLGDLTAAASIHTNGTISIK